MTLIDTTNTQPIGTPLESLFAFPIETSCALSALLNDQDLYRGPRSPTPSGPCSSAGPVQLGLGWVDLELTPWEVESSTSPSIPMTATPTTYDCCHPEDLVQECRLRGIVCGLCDRVLFQINDLN